MRTAHGFVLPYRLLVDLPGASATAEKIHRERRSASATDFTTLEAVRGHMRDAGHVKIGTTRPRCSARTRRSTPRTSRSSATRSTRFTTSRRDQARTRRRRRGGGGKNPK